MPAEIAFPKPDRYELQEIEPKEDVVRYGKLDISNEATRCQEEGILNDAADYQ